MRYIIWLTHGESVEVKDLDVATEGRWMALRHGVVTSKGTECACAPEDEGDGNNATPSDHDFEHFTQLLSQQNQAELEQTRQSLQRNIVFTEEALREEQDALEDFKRRLHLVERLLFVP